MLLPKKIGRDNASAQGQQAAKGQTQARAAQRGLGLKRDRPVFRVVLTTQFLELGFKGSPRAQPKVKPTNVRARS